VNYFDLHLGDYAKAAGHLSMLHEGAYFRLLRAYYADEKPLPVDLKKVQHRAGARTTAERRAVADVLEEFFELREDGWHNKRCDEVIADYQAGAPEREAKKAHEDERQHRHREERAKLFEQLRAAGIHADWNEKIGVLRDLVSRHCPPPAPAPVAPATGPVTPPATAPATPATATQSPSPTTQIDDDERASAGGTVDNSGGQPFDDPSAPQSVSDWAAFFAAEQSTPNADTSDEFAELAHRWLAAGVTRGRMRQACARARALATKPISYLPSYADSVLATLDAPVRLPKAEAPQARAERKAQPVTVTSTDADKTQELLAKQKLTPEQKAREAERAAQIRRERGLGRGDARAG
jgi:uncharacterized protein YdaU (DUF1376 family)